MEWMSRDDRLERLYRTECTFSVRGWGSASVKLLRLLERLPLEL